jgi:branched-chain amino acid transport system permease protein
LTVQVDLSNITPAGFLLNGHVKGSLSHAAPTVSFWQLFGQQLSQGLLLGLLLALAAIGLSLIYGTTGLSNFAHSEQITLGGFLAYVFAVQLGVNIILAAIIVIVLTALSGYLQDKLIWAPLRRRGLGLTQLMVVTIGLSLALEYVFQLIFGATVYPVATTLELNTGPLDITPTAYWSMLVSLITLALVGFALLFTRFGRATRAVADNRALAAASGIDVERVIRIVWIVSTGLAGLSGVLYALVNGGVYWLTGAQLLLLVFAAVTLGGIGTAFGALVGSLIIGVVANLSTLFIPQDLKYATGLVILIVVLLVRPQGILGRKERVG